MRLVGSSLVLAYASVYQQLRSFCRYGLELGRLGKAQVEARKAYDIARRGKIAPTVLQDVQVRRHVF